MRSRRKSKNPAKTFVKSLNDPMSPFRVTPGKARERRLIGQKPVRFESLEIPVNFI